MPARARRPSILWACTLMLLAPTMQALAQPVYRCGPAGNVYTHTPCTGGSGRVVNVADPRDASEWSEAADVAQRAAHTGLRMERERQHDEAAAANAGATRIAGGNSERMDRQPGQAPAQPKVMRAMAAKAVCGATAVKPKADAPRNCSKLRLHSNARSSRRSAAKAQGYPGKGGSRPSPG